MAGEDKEQIWNQKHAQAALRTIAVHVAAPATGAASELTLAQVPSTAASTAGGVVSPIPTQVVRAVFIPDAAVAAAGGTNYGTLTIGQRNPATGAAGADLTGGLNNQAALTAFAENAIVTAAQAVAAGQVLTLKNTPTGTGGAWQAGTIVLTVQG